MRDGHGTSYAARIPISGRLALAGLFLILLAPESNADPFTAHQAYVQAPWNDTFWDIEASQTGVPASGAQFDGFVLEQGSAAGCTSSRGDAPFTLDRGSIAASDNLDACDLADTFNLDAAFFPKDIPADALLLSSTTALPESPEQSESTVPFPISSSLWLLAALVVALVIFRGQRVFSARHFHRSKRH
jgi:hypothetical protein